MKMKLIVAALAAGLASPVAAATVLDFTSSTIGALNPTGSVFGIGYEITAGRTGGGGNLINSTHTNNFGCTGLGWNFACDPTTGSKYDVGFGVSSNEVEGITAGFDRGEYVQVKFAQLVNLLGFAGMLSYNDSAPTGGTEQVVLEYSADGGLTFASVSADAMDNDGNNTYATVGLAYARNLSILADVLRFKASGTSPFDDNNANITAAGLELAPAPVPVPAAFPLLLVGIGALGWASRRKRMVN